MSPMLTDGGTEALHVVCSRCLAGRGCRCVDRDGRETKTHAARRHEARWWCPRCGALVAPSFPIHLCQTEVAP